MCITFDTFIQNMKYRYAACDIGFTSLFIPKDCPEFSEAIVTTSICNDWITNCEMWKKWMSINHTNICEIQ